MLARVVWPRKLPNVRFARASKVHNGHCLDNQRLALGAFRGVVNAIAGDCLDRRANLVGPRIRQARQGSRPILFWHHGVAWSGRLSRSGGPFPFEAARHRLFSYLWEILAEDSAGHPLLILLDDLQWADELTTAFLTHVIEKRPITKSPIVVLGTYRSGGVNPGHRKTGKTP